jgi:hypothetical protein
MYPFYPETRIALNWRRLQLLNLGLKEQYRDSVKKLGFSVEDILDKERDAALGNGGLGRLAACYLDSGASTVRSLIFILMWMEYLMSRSGASSVGLRFAIQVWHLPAIDFS